MVPAVALAPTTATELGRNNESSEWRDGFMIGEVSNDVLADTAPRASAGLANCSHCGDAPRCDSCQREGGGTCNGKLFFLSEDGTR
jgi:hypothetical protein